MFVQVIEGQVANPEELARQFDQWRSEVKPGATGFLGSTAGVTDDGRAVLLARFESPDAARANSERPEQGAWWSQTEACFTGPVGFTDSTEVDTFLAGGSNDAGFVQVMKGSGGDRERLRRVDEALAAVAPELRPDLIGGYRVWTGPDTYVEAAYFTSEADARAGEQRQPPPEVAEQLSEMQSAMGNVEFLDLRALRFA